MNRKVVLLIFLTLLIVVPSVSAARSTGLFGGLFGDLGETLSDFFSSFINVEVRIPHPADYGDEKVTLGQIVLVFMLLYSMFWVGVMRTNIFKDMRGAGKAFTTALVLLLIFGSPITEWVSGLVNTLGRVSIVMLFVVAIFLIANLTRRGVAGAGTLGAEASKINADNLKAATKANQAIGLLKKEGNAARKMEELEKELKEECDTIRKQLVQIKKMLLELINVGAVTEEGRKLRQNIADNLTAVLKSMDGEHNTIQELKTNLAYSKNLNANVQAALKGYEDMITEIENEVAATFQNTTGQWNQGTDPAIVQAYDDLQKALREAQDFQSAVGVELINKIQVLVGTISNSGNDFSNIVRNIQSNLNTALNNVTGIQNAISEIDKLLAMNKQKSSIVGNLQQENTELRALVDRDKRLEKILMRKIKKYVKLCREKLNLVSQPIAGNP